MEVNECLRIVIDIPFKHITPVFRSVINKSGKRADIEGKLIGERKGIDALPLLIEFSIQRYRHLLQTRPAAECMHISVQEITVRIDQNRIQPDPFRNYRILHISFKHHIHPVLAPFIAPPFQMSGIMHKSIPLSDSEQVFRLWCRHV